MKNGDTKTEKVARIIRKYHGQKLNNLLVVGCASGLEAAILAQRLKVNVIGIDIKNNFDNEAKKYASLQVANAMSLEFPDASFDFVYSYHALEHISNPLLALKEMKRVLRDGGGYWIGAPNRSRVLGYIGSKNATIKQKIKWNFSDWQARVTGQFKNELGAHAGFTAAELNLLLQWVFSYNKNLSTIYYEEIYSNKRLLIKLINLLSLSNIIYPSVYFMGQK